MVPPVLRIATYLGRNTVEAFEDLARHPGPLGPVELVPVADESERARLCADGAVDVWWMCGLLTAVLLDEQRLAGTVVAAPVFAGQREALYHSVVIVRHDDAATTLADLAGRRLGINETASWSGYHALRVHFDRRGFDPTTLAEVARTGSHAASIEAVADGSVDAAAIDHSIWDHAREHQPRLTYRLRVLDVTDDWPAPPLTVASHVDPDRHRAIVAGLLAAGPLRGITRFVPASSADYDPMRTAYQRSLTLPW